LKNAILVPLDGTLLAERALPVALAVAQRTGAELHPVLVHVTDFFADLGLEPGPTPGADEAQSEHEVEYLDSVAARLSAEGVHVHAPVVLRGQVPEEVARHVNQHGIEGVVMATHGRGSFERLLVPSVAEGLRRRIGVPMILVRADAEAPASESFAAVAPPRTVLVGLDGSADAEAALDAAIEVAGPEARYVLLRVASPPPQLSTTFLPRAAILRHADEERLREESAAYLSSIEERIRERAPLVEKRSGLNSRPGRLVVSGAEEVGADLIALGGHGHGLVRQALFGSVTHDVLAEARAPVLVARAPE
jgi:nucleotide-binding universal stress UspA family protein